MPKLQDLTGKKFERLTVISRAESKSKKIRWNCVCDCGGKAVVFGQYLKSGRTKSCGCFQKEQMSLRRFKHGLANNRDKKYTQETRLKYKYGISVEQWNKMFESQNGSCLICRYKFGQKKSDCYVDHCHNTSVVRGLLCQPCNSTIGYAKDNPDILRSAAEYLLRFKASEN
jgi:hypothetical protein